ncbi:3' exoribonuclease family protein [Teratosphaeria destructans]|uniref:3' exoribonuclease family protein n=1 Tax=Teratosphaeria destructans TaxID=418781 RepID=A0A9W7T003_9PEZI|nr:3' exoribonuclease family protein [Teratosphaeria destructans]
MQADRRRLNAPAGGTAPPVFATPTDTSIPRPARTRTPDEHRKIFLRTGVVPSASGSAYYEIPPQSKQTSHDLLVPHASSLKITCTVHGPRPLPRNAAFSPNLLLTTHVKFAPFATRIRRGYVRDSTERDLGVHLETALRGVVIGERWPKSGCEVVITVLEGEEDGWWCDAGASGETGGGWGLMGVLAGSITVASAALVDAGIDCVDLISGGVAAMIGSDGGDGSSLVLDPQFTDHEVVKAACVVGYLQSRDEVTEMWIKGDVGQGTEQLVDEAVKAASLSRTVLVEAVKESVQGKMASVQASKGVSPATEAKKGKATDVVMTG